MIVEVPVSIGELVDKVTILLIKSQHATVEQQKTNIDKELSILQNKTDALGIGGHPAFASLLQALTNINAAIWRVENELRKPAVSDADYVKFSRQTHAFNDERAAVKRQINRIFQSDIVEEKIYQE
jgi:hypothetical protein